MPHRLSCREIDIHDDEQFQRHWELVTEAESFERPHHTPITMAALRTIVRAADRSVDRQAWAAFDGESMVGAGWAELFLLDNTSMAWLTVNVVPALRRRGIGSALCAAMVEDAKARGRTIMLGGTAYPPEARADHPYRRFAESQGFTLANTEVHRVLDLPVDEEFLGELVRESAVHHPAYQVRHFAGRLPDELLPSYCALQNQLAVDAPTGEMEFEAERLTPEVLLEQQEVRARAGQSQLSALAVTAAGEVVAYNDLVVPADEPGVVHQWGTLVHRDHRGHRLGMAVKARNLLELQHAHPDRKRVHTGNAEVNRWMVDINERLGFRPVELFAEFQRKL
ncbi:MAG TPA: GNAT family N-acetyltransferase [Dermatophilaceae bacterium]|nr:GNAT family N-acetyltransferase [Dermatophilaceae bacterium]